MAENNEYSLHKEDLSPDDFATLLEGGETRDAITLNLENALATLNKRRVRHTRS